jgi:hypothetical protein
MAHAGTGKKGDFISKITGIKKGWGHGYSSRTST